MVWLVIAGAVVGVLLVAVLVAVAIGASLPVEHTAARRVGLSVDRQLVWDALTDVAAFPSWRPRVKRVDVLDADPPRWREVGKDGKITFETVESAAPARLVTKITDLSLPFGGTWTYELEPAGDGCVVTVTEHGQVRNLVFRFMSRFVLGHTATIDGYLKALGNRFDQDVEPKPVHGEV